MVLLDRLGVEPVAPKAISGSGKAHRFHLYFRCAILPTKAKQTPWHEHLEFRGKGGIIIAPPSLHKSGNRYAWAKGRSPIDIPLPEVPQQVLEALMPSTVPPLPPGKRQVVPGDLDAARTTLTFLTGKHANGP